ncbi:hypothetical protein [Roseomonas marmotae]|uniref:Uncharacterized protein n=1 Tax=Roseomonas marmotae TaxID=2768161 RepID=A0ABS3K8V4_9PROT|nr:hypothetical protein [Roseomonas marmotae]MBO1073894.1 hypothetical protein [Roseomonas marmotae]QTI78487.1 hypothetical protein IAI58_12445 [Roseomonas marmotae]
MSDTRVPASGTPAAGTPNPDPASEAPRSAPQEGIGPNATTREGAVQPRTTDRHAPMPERPISATDARQGKTLGHVRWVLIISLALAVVAMILVAVWT